MRYFQFKRNSYRFILLYIVIVLSIAGLIISLFHDRHSNSNHSGEKFESFQASVVEHGISTTTTTNPTTIIGRLESQVKIKIDSCETIHLAIVCGGFNSTRSFYVLLKSILFHRTDRIHLHLFVDNISRIILKELFRTWPIQDLDFEFYNVVKYEHEISWISSQHYSHHYGLMKLVLISVLAERKDLSRLIIMDTDMLALGNINQIWKETDVMSNEGDEKYPIFGMVENQSDWYLNNVKSNGNNKVWPAIGRGFNSGLILVNLIKLRYHNWKQIWRQTAESELTYYLSTALVDQDIFNAIIRLHSQMIYRLPCYFNKQLNDHTRLKEVCAGQRREFELVHWNSPYKLHTKNPMAEYYKDWYLNFQNWDGTLVKQNFCHRTKAVEPEENHSKPADQGNSDEDPTCKDIRPQPHDKLRTFLYFMEFEVENENFAVTLAVHFSMDRIQVFDQLASRWPGPISAAIYLPESETNLLFESIECSNNLAQRKNIGYHLVFRDHGFNYPINRLRNVALNNTLSPYVFVSDVDFLPSANLYDYLRQTIYSMSILDNDPNPLTARALVIPAFENLQYKFKFPASKVELLTQFNLGSVSMFRDQIWPPGQAPTNYARWRAATKPYKVDWEPEYEPFIVTSSNMSRFDERFVGFGWNKVENIMLLAALNYEFIVLPEAFLIHQFHSASFDIIKHRQSMEYRTCNKKLRKKFLLELKENYPNFFQTNKSKQ